MPTVLPAPSNGATQAAVAPAAVAPTAATAPDLPAPLSAKRKAIADALDDRGSLSEKEEGVIGQALLRPADAAGRNIFRRREMGDYLSSLQSAFPTLSATAAEDGYDEDEIDDTFFSSMFSTANTHRDHVYKELADGMRAVLAQGVANQVHIV